MTEDHDDPVRAFRVACLMEGRASERANSLDGDAAKRARDSERNWNKAARMWEEQVRRECSR